MMKFVVAATLVSAAEAGNSCDGSPCQMIGVSTPTRLTNPEDPFPEPTLGVNTFTAVDKCATQEVTDLTGWVLQYYEKVSNELDESFSNILTIARMANSALFQLSHLSAEMAAYQRINEIATQMNSMLRTCLADAMHLSASLERCDGAFAQNSFGMDGMTSAGGSGIESVWVHAPDMQANHTCLASVCQHQVAWNDTCGKVGFLGDLERIAAAHDLEGHQFAFSSGRGNWGHQAPTSLYGDDDDAGTFAIYNEDLFTQEYALLARVSSWIEVQMHGMMVMIRRSLAGGQFAQQSDLDLCNALGFPVEQTSWLSLAFEKCEGSMARTWLKVTPLNKKYMHKLVEALAKKIPNVYKSGNPGVLYGGALTNLCTKFQDLEPEIKAEMAKLQAEHAAMNGASADPHNINTFYLNGVAPVSQDGQYENKMVPFDKDTKQTQQWFMADSFMKSPLGNE